ncbi:MAG: chemotaxis protein CheW [Gemmatimonadaceae bacterium]
MGGGEGRRYLLARAADQRVAFPLDAVREIIPPRVLTRLPGAGAWVLGLLNLRGLVLTVVDLTVRFGGTPGDSPSIVVLEMDGRLLGVQVTAVSAVSASADGTEAAVDDARSAEGLVRGLVEVPGGTALVIDVKALQHAALAAV